MRVLELYSGIGGMHMALKESEVNGEIAAAIDVNTVANEVYRHNFPTIQCLNGNIQGLTVDYIENLNIDTILMSPPCQPFTRNGLQKDILDPRTNSFVHLLQLIPKLSLKNILIENVKGFESSVVRNKLIDMLQTSGFVYQEFLLNPSDFGVPNSRLRYYCIATKSSRFKFDTNSEIMTAIPSCSFQEVFPMSAVIENLDNFSCYQLSDTVLQKRALLLDICNLESRSTCCFTKAYSRYVEGTGSVFTSSSTDEISRVFEQLKDLDSNSEEYIGCLRRLKLRFFTPKEVCRLMCFPESFSFPPSVKDSQKYKLLGNSINVRVVSLLLKLF